MKHIFYTALLTTALSLPALAQTGTMKNTTGTMGDVTRPSSASIAVSTLDAAAIREIQTALRDAGFPPGPVDGLWGPRTASSLQRFQQNHGLARAGAGANARASTALIHAETLSALGIGLDEIRPAAGRISIPERTPLSSMDGMDNTMDSNDVIDNDRLESNGMK